MFSGQGSQYYHMGKELFDHNMIFREWMIRQDEILTHLIGESVIDKIYDPQMKVTDVFDQTLFTHPAIFMVEYAIAKVIAHIGIAPEYVLGASLGEFAAATTSDVIALEDALKAVVKQAEHLEMFCRGGRMLAILHDINLFYNERYIFERSELAALNYESHFVIAGETVNIEKIAAFLGQKKIMFQKLPVSFAFHSQFVSQAERPYKAFLKNITISHPKISFGSSATGNIIEKISNDYFWDIVFKPIKFANVVRELEKRGNNIYLDLGPSGTLAALTKFNLASGSDSEVYSILTPYKRDLINLEKIKKIENS